MNVLAVSPFFIAHNGYGFMSVLFLPNSKNRKLKNKIALKPMLGVSKIFNNYFFARDFNSIIN